VPCLTRSIPATRSARCHARTISQRLSPLICYFAVGCLPVLSADRPQMYRSPWLVLAYPDQGKMVPPDRPLVVLRFSSREANDPIDPSSFRAAIDGADRTPLFRLTAGEAWAMLADSASAVPVVTPGPHAVSARICSARGACTRLDVTLLVGPAAMTAAK